MTSACSATAASSNLAERPGVVAGGEPPQGWSPSPPHIVADPGRDAPESGTAVELRGSCGAAAPRLTGVDKRSGCVSRPSSGPPRRRAPSGPRLSRHGASHPPADRPAGGRPADGSLSGPGRQAPAGSAARVATRPGVAERDAGGAPGRLRRLAADLTRPVLVPAPRRRRHRRLHRVHALRDPSAVGLRLALGRLDRQPRVDPADDPHRAADRQHVAAPGCVDHDARRHRPLQRRQPDLPLARPEPEPDPEPRAERRRLPRRLRVLRGRHRHAHAAQLRHRRDLDAPRRRDHRPRDRRASPACSGSTACSRSAASRSRSWSGWPTRSWTS